jgi:hypothetical protein
MVMAKCVTFFASLVWDLESPIVDTFVNDESLLHTYKGGWTCIGEL